MACLEKVDVLQATLVASVRRVPPRFMRNIAGWQETGEEMAGNGGVFIKHHQLMETQHRRNIELAQEVDDDQMNTDHTREPVGDEFINRKRLNTSKRLPTTHMAYSITNKSDGSTVCHVSHIVKK